jgi:hypothetical protein
VGDAQTFLPRRRVDGGEQLVDGNAHHHLDQLGVGDIGGADGADQLAATQDGDAV